MAAKDYKICVTLRNAYIAKLRADNTNVMTDDRRPIDEGEIMMLIDWYLDDRLGKEYKTLTFDSQIREGKRVEIKFIDNKE